MKDNRNGVNRALVDEQGGVAFGRFSYSLGRINGRDARYLTPMGKPAGCFARHFHYKQFQYFGLINERFLLGCALADTAWLGVVFVYVHDLETGRFHEWSWNAPLGRGLVLCDSPRRGESHFRRGKNRIRMRYEDTPDGLVKYLHIDMAGAELHLDAAMTENADYQPMSLCTRTGVNGFTYANKVAGVRVRGELAFGGRRWSLNDLSTFGHHDFTAGYLRRETFWNWACASAGAGGHDLGFNLSCGVNETSFSENCLWLDGRLIPVGGMHFEYQREAMHRPWEISDEQGRVRLTFQPAGRHEERMNLELFASNFQQLFGTFSGRIQVQGQQLEVSGIHGFVEEQYAKW